MKLSDIDEAASLVNRLEFSKKLEDGIVAGDLSISAGGVTLTVGEGDSLRPIINQAVSEFLSKSKVDVRRRLTEIGIEHEPEKVSDITGFPDDDFAQQL